MITNIENSNKKGIRFDIFKLILAFMVFGIHTYLLPEHLRPVLRTAVPLFFMLSSFFYFSKPDACSWKSVKHYSVRILKLYLFWFVFLLIPTLYFRSWFESGFIKGIIGLLKSFLFCVWGCVVYLLYCWSKIFKV